jgi:hypothetical protein
MRFAQGRVKSQSCLGSGSSHNARMAGPPAGLMRIAVSDSAGSAYSAGTALSGRSLPGSAARHSASAKKKSPNIVALSTPSLCGFE